MIPAGTVICVSLEQFWNVYGLQEVIEAGRTSLVRFVQPLKALSPKVCTESGR